MSEDEIRKIVLDEFRYWRDQEPAEESTSHELIVIGAMGAASNILAAISGHPAPWHTGLDVPAG